MKKGFTLIELLAVIVILAIIAVIAVPIVLNIINDSKESSLLRSAEFYLSAAEYAVADAYLYHGGLESRDYPITPNGDICTKPLPCDDEHTLKVEVNGDKPTGGSITINNGNISDVKIILDEKTIIKQNGELVYQNSTANKPCTLIEDNGTKNTLDIGDKITCSTESFYVVSNNGSNIELLTEKNINVTGVGDVKQMDNAGSVGFASTAYFGENTTIYSKYQKEEKGSGTYVFFPDEVYYIYDENAIPYSYVQQYSQYLSNFMNVLDIKLLSFSEFIDIAIYDESGAEGLYIGPRWIMGDHGDYFLGSIYFCESRIEYAYMMEVSDYYLTSHNDSPNSPMNEISGIRPVVTISINEVKIN